MPIYINTNQNVNITYEICSIGSRILAFLIDIAVILAIYLILGAIIGITDIGTNSPSFYSLIAMPLFFYHLISELSMNGQSIGKRSAKIRVMKTDGSSASFTNYFLRFLLRPIDSLYFIGLVFIFFTKKGQRLGDLAANTTLIKIKEDVTFSSLKQSMESSHKTMTFQEVDQLKDTEIQIIKKVLNNWKNQPKHENVILLAEKTQKLLDIETDLPPYQFLKTILEDYHSKYSE